MLGVLDSDNLAQVLRGISQKRRQGVLELKYPESRSEIVFVQGRIVNFIINDLSPNLEIVELLKGAGLVSEVPEGLPDLKLEQLFAELNRLNGNSLDETTFKNLLKHRVLDKLYSIDLSTGAYYSFSVKMVQSEGSFTPSISVGQLLLDLVALEADSQKIAELFSGKAKIVRSLDTAPQLSSEVEELVYRLLDVPLTVGELKSRSLLSKYHLQDVLISLHSKGLVRSAAVLEERLASSPKRIIFEEKLFQSIDSSIDKVFKQEEEEQRQDEKNSLEDKLDTSPAGQLDHVIVDEEEASPSELPSLRIRMGLFSMRLLSQNWPLHTTVFIFLIIVIVCPLVYWGEIFQLLGGY